MVIMKSLIILIWLPYIHQQNHIRKLRIVISISMSGGKNGNDFEMDDLAKFLECQRHIIYFLSYFKFACMLASLCLLLWCLCMAWFVFGVYIPYTFFFDEIGEANGLALSLMNLWRRFLNLRTPYFHMTTSFIVYFVI